MRYSATIFAFDDVMVRVVVDVEGMPRFVACDIRSALGHANPSRSVSSATAGGTERCYVEGLSRVERVTLLSSFETYLLVANAKTETRDRLLEWLVETVTPAIYIQQEFVVYDKNGEYDNILHWILNNTDSTEWHSSDNGELYHDYLIWSRQNNVSAEAFNAFSGRLAELGVEQQNSQYSNGIALRQDSRSIDRSVFASLDTTRLIKTIKGRIQTAKLTYLQQSRQTKSREMAAINRALSALVAQDAQDTVVAFPLQNQSGS